MEHLREPGVARKLTWCGRERTGGEDGLGTRRLGQEMERENPQLSALPSEGHFAFSGLLFTLLSWPRDFLFSCLLTALSLLRVINHPV